MPLSNPKPVAAKYPALFSRLKTLGERKPQLRFGLLPRQPAGALRLVLPFRRNWLVIGIVGVVLSLFSLPLFGILGQAGPREGDLFSLVFTLFHLFWALGWSVGVGIIALVFLALLLGREVVVVRSDALLARLELLGLGVGGEYAAAGISNLRSAQPEAATGTSWRGPHLAFDYYGVPVAFGSDLEGPRAAELLKLVTRKLALPAAANPALAPIPQPDPALAGESNTGWEELERPISGDEPSGGSKTDGATGIGSPSSLALILANLVPLAGVWLLGWDIGEIMLLYWAESGIVGIFNLFKLVVVGRWAALFYGPFFVGHYGAFMAGHLLFIYIFFVKGIQAGGDLALAEVAARFLPLWPALLALVISHGISFVVNFLGHREYAETTAQKQMAEPYSRIIIMHLTIIFGGFVVMGLGSSLPALLLMMGAKIGVDLRAHSRQRK